ncbi:MAG: hypothetical protein LBS31_07990, partial [Candidatus Adiutrix sp.]|nr:hypothetical protein [Candidatus Adiutrix sp.]
ATAGGSGQWHGNWLNFATTSRMDAIRKVLYGGKRYVDTAAQTVLELTSFIPANSHAWGGELLADNLWAQYAKTSPWYDIPSFTGYTRPAAGTMHFWCRSSYYTPAITSGGQDQARTKSADPLFMVAAHIPSTNWHPIYKTPLRIWDWVGDHGGGSLPDDHNLIAGPNAATARAFATTAYDNKPANQAARRFIARVEVCKANSLSPTEGCRAYGTSDKPIGLLQEYGESGKMFFGLMTGTIQATTRYEGGVVRHHIQPFENYVGADGLIKRPGLIDTIDRLQITGIGGFEAGNGNNTSVYTDGTQAGNPLGEMLYEATRYLARRFDGTGLTPSTAYVPASEVTIPAYNSVTTKSQLPRLTAWSDRPDLGETATKCPKPVILMLSEVFTDHDANNFPNLSQLNSVPLTAHFAGSPVPQQLNITTYLNLISAQEKLSTDASDGKHFFYPNQPRGTCIPAALTGLAAIQGHCPSEPSLQGSYSLAAVAYYAHTHDLYNLGGQTDPSHSEKSIDFYAVGIPPNFPDITFTVDENRSLTLMPITVASDLGTSTQLRTLINFYVESWETDNSPAKRPFRVKFATNFEYNTNPSWTNGSGSNNMERDIFNRFEIILLTTSATPAAYREATPVFINSGPLRTKDSTLWYEHKAAATGLPTDFPDTPAQPYYYAFKNPNPNQVATPLDIDNYRNNIVGVAIQNYSHGSFINMHGLGGYTISGVTRPGAYLEVGYNGLDNGVTCNTGGQPVVLTADYRDTTGCGVPAGFTDRQGLPPGHRNPSIADEFLTPWECPFAGYTNADRFDADVIRGYGNLASNAAASICGTATANGRLTRYYQMRSFEFDSNATLITKLPNPMLLAAKYGGFKDGDAAGQTGHGYPDKDAEWKRGGEGMDKDDPYNYFGVTNISQLPDQLGAAFEAIANSVATGTANASSMNTVLGGGLSIQTQYNTEYEDPDGAQIKWGGTVYALFVDKWGNLREDTNGDGKLTLATSPNLNDWDVARPKKDKPATQPEDGDKIVHTVPSSGLALPSVYLCRDPGGDNNGNTLLPSDSHPPTGYPPLSDCVLADSMDPTSMARVKTVWNVAKNLSEIADPTDPDLRRLYAYYETENADGKTAWPDGGVNLAGYPFETAAAGTTPVTPGPLHRLMGLGDVDTTKKIIEYTLGKDFPGELRNRTVRPPWDKNGPARVWRLGDVINSKPVIVGSAMSNYHLLYGDESFAAYKDDPAISRRRQVAYFGSNDGIFHAVNLGFFGSLQSGEAGYQNEETNPRYQMGEEMWGLVPTSVLPHLQWLADVAYSHGYFVDLQPYVVDVKNASGQWRTLMIVGLRLGGRTVKLVNDTTPSYSYSEFFALDVTDPEDPPTLLWRFAGQHLGLTSASPTVVRSGLNWYVVLPSGPTSDLDSGGVRVPDTGGGGSIAYEGRSTQNARVIVLNALTGELARDRDKHPELYSDPDPLMAPEPNSFFNDTFTPLAASVQEVTIPTPGLTWTNHVVYMGLTAKDGSNRDTGAIYRLQMADTDGTALDVDDWKLVRFYNTDKPVTGAVNSAYDSLGNLWVVFGTGRIWAPADLAPCGIVKTAVAPTCAENHDQYIFGLKEPLNASGQMTYAEVVEGGANPPIVDVSGLTVYDQGALSPNPNGTGKVNYDALSSMMKAKDSDGKPVVRGYKRKLESWKVIPGSPDPGPTVFELVSTQPKIDGLPNGGSNMVFTSYLTSDNICDPSGESYLQVADTFTGLPAPYMKSYGFTPGGSLLIEDKMANQVTGVKKAGAGMASEAWVLKTGEGTVYGNTSFNSNRNTLFLRGDESEASSVVSWREVLDMGFDLKENEGALFNDLLPPSPPQP